MELSLRERALMIAAGAHRQQVRKEADTPYITHPVMVAWILDRYGFDETVIAAALVHDVLEDTEYPEQRLEEELGTEVMAIVRAVTNDDSLSWKEKKQKYIQTVAEGGEGAWAVATADKIHNAQSLLLAHERQGEGLWTHFNASKEDKLWFEEAMLEMLKARWAHPLVEKYEGYVGRMRDL